MVLQPNSPFLTRIPLHIPFSLLHHIFSHQAVTGGIWGRYGRHRVGTDTENGYRYRREGRGEREYIRYSFAIPCPSCCTRIHCLCHCGSLPASCGIPFPFPCPLSSSMHPPRLSPASSHSLIHSLILLCGYPFVILYNSLPPPHPQICHQQKMRKCFRRQPGICRKPATRAALEGVAGAFFALPAKEAYGFQRAEMKKIGKQSRKMLL